MRRIVSSSGSFLATLLGLWILPTLAASAATRAEPDDEEDLVIIDDSEMEGDEPAGADTPPETDASADLFAGESVEDEFQAAPADAEVGKQDADSKEKQIQADTKLIRVIQRQRMLKKGRFELQPQVGISINDPYVRHYTVGLDLNYWLTNRMAIGLTGTGLIGALTPRYDNIRLQTGLLLTANELLWQASVNYTYNPFYGKIAIFNRALLHWEGGLQIGGGAMQTRIIPRYRALHEPFTTFTGGGHFGLISRFYIPRVDWLSINLGVRTWIFPDKLEPGRRGPDDGPGGRDDPSLVDPQRAKDASDFQVAYNVLFFLGGSFYLPSSFEYTTPR
jgi:outer membrane beta-barrel protein